MAQIECKDLTLSYDKRVIAADINFSINQGEFLAVVGENGSGKSTLIKTILGLQPPHGGSISFEAGFSNTEIGYLPQQSGSQKDFPATVKEIVISGTLKKGKFFYTKKDKALCEKNMKLLGIDTLKNRSFRELSGGQQQRVLLARALCAAKKLLVLDEPTSGLDPIITKDFYEIIKELNRVEKMSIIMVSHSIDMALSNASHILHLGNGETFFGTTDDYLKTELGKAFYNAAKNKAENH